MFQGAVKAQERCRSTASFSIARMTFNDSSLEREILELFDRQAELLLSRMTRSEPPAIATLAHTLKGSAVGIGAGRVARAAAATELAARFTRRDCSEAMDRLVHQSVRCGSRLPDCCALTGRGWRLGTNDYIEAAPQV